MSLKLQGLCLGICLKLLAVAAFLYLVPRGQKVMCTLIRFNKGDCSWIPAFVEAQITEVLLYDKLTVGGHW